MEWWRSNARKIKTDRSKGNERNTAKWKKSTNKRGGTFVLFHTHVICRDVEARLLFCAPFLLLPFHHLSLSLIFKTMTGSLYTSSCVFFLNVFPDACLCPLCPLVHAFFQVISIWLFACSTHSLSINIHSFIHSFIQLLYLAACSANGSPIFCPHRTRREGKKNQGGEECEFLSFCLSCSF